MATLQTKQQTRLLHQNPPRTSCNKNNLNHNIVSTTQTARADLQTFNLQIPAASSRRCARGSRRSSSRSRCSCRRHGSPRLGRQWRHPFGVLHLLGQPLVWPGNVSIPQHAVVSFSSYPPVPSLLHLRDGRSSRVCDTGPAVASKQRVFVALRRLHCRRCKRRVRLR